MAIRLKYGDYMLYLVAIPLLFVFDQLTKYFTLKFLNEFESVNIIKGFLSFTHVHNTGGPWSIFSDKPYVFVVMTIIIFAIGLIYFKKNKPEHFLCKASICLIAGGALGNFADRLFRGYVVDMIDVNLFDYPVFNVADCYIVVGSILLCVYVLFFEKEKK